MTQQINLLDPSLLKGQDWASGKLVVGVLAVALIAVGAHLGYEQRQWQIATEQAAKNDAAREASAAAAQQVVAQLAQLQAQLAADDQMRRAAAAMVDPPQNSVQRFEELIAGLSSNMWMQSVEFDGARGVHIVVSGLQQSELARYADGLSGSKAFTGLPIELLSVERKEQTESEENEGSKGAVRYYTFELRGSDNIQPAAGTTP